MKISKSLIAIALSMTFASFANAQTGIKMAGTVAFKATPSGSNYVWSGSLTEVRNYDYSDASSLRFAIVASRSCARSGNLTGTVAAVSRSFFLPSRTYITSIKASGRTRRLNQSLCVHGLIVDSANRIRARQLIGNFRFRSLRAADGQIANSDSKLRLQSSDGTAAKLILE